MSPADVLAGRRLGQYQLVERVGAGGMASVYRALQPALGREVAIKVLGDELARQPGFLQRFEHEARTLARLDHPYILPIFDFGTEDGITFIVSPLVTGGTLADALSGSPLPAGEAWRYASLIGHALHHAHQAGVVHRDLKPRNVLRHADGRLLLADFGLARSTVAPVGLTQPGLAVGTAGYMAPEQAMGAPVDRRADVYALGVIVFEMLTGTRPFPAGDPHELGMATIQRPIPSARDRNPTLPSGIDGVLAGALARTPEDRTQTVERFVGDLTAVLMTSFPGAAVNTPPAIRALTPPAGRAPDAGRARSAPSAPVISSAVATLEHMGVRRRRPTGRRLQNSFFFHAFQAATEAAGEDGWVAFLAASGLERFTQVDPPDGPAHETPSEALGWMGRGFETIFATTAPERLRTWGRLTGELEVAFGRFRAGRPLLPRSPRRRIAELAASWTAGMNAVRGEALHDWRQLDDARVWLVAYANPLVRGRSRAEKSCHFWIAHLETVLRESGLANDWVVEEVECGAVTGTGDCVFSITCPRRL